MDVKTIGWDVAEPLGNQVYSKVAKHEVCGHAAKRSVR